MTGHLLGLLHEHPDSIARTLTLAAGFKAGRRETSGAGRVLVQVYFNPSLRTRTSMEAAMLRLGGNTITLTPGQGMWEMEHRDGVVMNQAPAEHFREGVPVLARFGDLLGVRSFAGLTDFAADREDAVLNAFAKLSPKPVINLESAREHPCQGLADLLTLREKLGELRGKRFVVTWAPHVKPLPLAVCHSALLAAASAGMEVVLARPDPFHPDPGIVEEARQRAESLGGYLTVTDDQEFALSGAAAVYAKSWGAIGAYGNPDLAAALFSEHAGWMLTGEKMRNGGGPAFMHCLPVRRNVVVTDEVLDHPSSVVIDQAENRMWVQMAAMHRLLTERAS